MDLSQEISKESGVDDCLVKIYASDGYGSPDIVREIIHYEHPDLILLITDPRFFGWFAPMEHELKTVHKIKLCYLNIWDNLIFPHYNSSMYASMDLLMSINRQTKVINQEVLKYHGTKTVDIDKNPAEPNSTLLAYLPHGLNPKNFFKETEESHDYAAFQEFQANFKKQHPETEFIVFFNSRNIRRKQPGDVILAYKRFCDQLSKEDAKKCCLLMKTQIQDENGTDLMAVKKAICPKYKILFNQDNIPTQVLNWFYNISDCTIFMSSAEGFGLAGNESLLSETILIAPVTGGLQDQMRFEDENGKWIEFDEEFTTNHRGKYKKCGEWALPIFPRTRQLQGSIPTPYIFDDCSDAQDGADRIMEVWLMSKEERERRGRSGREWAMGEESGMSSPEMAKRFIKSVDTLLETWTPPEKFTLRKVEPRKVIENSGIQW